MDGTGKEVKGRANPKEEFGKSHMEIDSLRTNFTTWIEGKKRGVILKITQGCGWEDGGDG